MQYLVPGKLSDTLTVIMIAIAISTWSQIFPSDDLLGFVCLSDF